MVKARRAVLSRAKRLVMKASFRGFQLFLFIRRHVNRGVKLHEALALCGTSRSGMNAGFGCFTPPGDSLDGFPTAPPGEIKFVGRLEVHPKIGRCTEILAQS